jgi:hypothetical protein
MQFGELRLKRVIGLFAAMLIFSLARVGPSIPGGGVLLRGGWSEPHHRRLCTGSRTGPSAMVRRFLRAGMWLTT